MWPYARARRLHREPWAPSDAPSAIAVVRFESRCALRNGRQRVAASQTMQGKPSHFPLGCPPRYQKLPGERDISRPINRDSRSPAGHELYRRQMLADRAGVRPDSDAERHPLAIMLVSARFVSRRAPYVRSSRLGPDLGATALAWGSSQRRKGSQPNRRRKLRFPG